MVTPQDPSNPAESPSLRGLALFANRILIAAIFLWHGVPKATDFAMASEKFAGWGIPGFLGPVIGIVEVFAGFLLVIGLVHRSVGLILCLIIGGALFLVQIPGGITADLERDLLILVGLVVLLTHGPGSFTFRGGPKTPHS